VLLLSGPFYSGVSTERNSVDRDAESQELGSNTSSRVVLAEFFTMAYDQNLHQYPARRALDQLADEFDTSTFIYLSYFHDSDSLGKDAGKSRSQFYGIWSYPTVVFNGLTFISGSTSTSWCYDQYKNEILAQSTIDSDVQLTIEGTISNGGLGHIDININSTRFINSTNLHVFTGIIEDDVEYDGWNLNRVTRRLLPSEHGEKINLTHDKSVNLSYDFISDPDWVLDNLRCIAWVQNCSQTNTYTGGGYYYTSEVIQSSIADFVPIPNNPPELLNGTAIPMRANESEAIEFKVLCRDKDDIKPRYVRLQLRNETNVTSISEMREIRSNTSWTSGHEYRYSTTLPSGDYSFRFVAFDGVDNATGDVEWHEGLTVDRPVGLEAFKLRMPDHSPDWGYADTLFTFSIEYYDELGRLPSYALLNIDGMFYDLEIDNVSVQGEWKSFSCETYLAIGENHWYYLLFGSDDLEIRIPWGELVLKGPIVISRNSAPILIEPYLSPHTGSRLDTYTFRVKYLDLDGDPPSESLIIIDNETYQMATTENDYLNGTEFTMRRDFHLGTHNYYFLFEDDEHRVRLPPSGVFSGPVVKNLPPVASIDHPRPDSLFNTDEGIAFSAIGSYDPERDSLNYSWYSDLDGKISSKREFMTTLSEGPHNISLVIVDDYGSQSLAWINVRVVSPPPSIELINLQLDKETAYEGEILEISVEIVHDGGPPMEGVSISLSINGELISDASYSLREGESIVLTFNWSPVAGNYIIQLNSLNHTIESSYIVYKNRAPAVFIQIDEPTVERRVGTPINIRAIAHDYENQSIELTWLIDGIRLSHRTSNITHAFNNEGVHNITVIAEDPLGLSNSATTMVTILGIEPQDNENTDNIYWIIIPIIIVVSSFIAWIVLKRRGDYRV
jgi:hypothetical protein